jgi:hypothetical protein
MSTRVNYQIQHLVRACFEEFLSVQEGRVHVRSPRFRLPTAKTPRTRADAFGAPGHSGLRLRR